MKPALNCLEYIYLSDLQWRFLTPYSLIGGSDYKLIYRHYATLYFVFCVDSSESELGILDLIQVSFDFILLLYGHLHKPDTAQASQI